jgi:prevent-host-death family protein
MSPRKNVSSIATISSREFNQDTSRAKKAARRGPVFITDRGRPAHVLLTIEEYERLAGTASNIVDLLAQAGGEDIEFEAPRVKRLHRTPDLSS